MVRSIVLIMLLILFLVKWVVGYNIIKREEIKLIKLKSWIFLTIIIEFVFVFGNLVFNR